MGEQEPKKSINWRLILPMLFIAVVWWHFNSGSSDDQMTIPGATTEQAQKAGKPVNPIYSQFLKDVKAGKIAEVGILTDGSTGIIVIPKDGKRYKTYSAGDPGLMGDLISQPDLKIYTFAPPPPGFFESYASILVSVGILALFAYVFLFKKNGMGGMGGADKFTKAKAAIVEETNIKVTFADVAGCEEAKEDIREMAGSLLDPTLLTDAGGIVPHGILLLGPPGTGKTLLARAVAGEMNLKFKNAAKGSEEAKQVTVFNVSGSTFVEMFVGVGSSRVHDLFVQAKARAPAIIFIDELDAIGRQRGGKGDNNDERNQALNQLLVEMDGFEGLDGVVVMAATNLPDVLDKGLLRPGRFDRQITLNNPDILGRVEVFNVHTKNKHLAPDVKIFDLARGTPGMSCAHIANICNEAALFASRNGRKIITMVDLERAKDKVLMGPENRTLKMNDDEKWMTAIHEGGHAVVGSLSKEHDPAYKVSIMPRARALGITMFLPERDSYSASKRKLHSQIRSLFGGRIAEEMYSEEKCGDREDVSTGAQNDIMRATDLAKAMVTQWGLSRLGPRSFVEEGHGPQYLGGAGMFQSQTSQDVAKKIDAEIDYILDERYKEAEEMLHSHKSELWEIAKALMEWETIGVPQLDALMAGKTMKSGEVPIPVGFVEKPIMVTSGKQATPVVDLTKPEGKQE
jgi:cell division protease FtsH